MLLLSTLLLLHQFSGTFMSAAVVVIVTISTVSCANGMLRLTCDAGVSALQCATVSADPAL